MLKILIGFLVVMAAVGTTEGDPDASLVLLAVFGLLGCGLAYWGALDIQEKERNGDYK